MFDNHNDFATLEELGEMAQTLRLLPEQATMSDQTRERMAHAAHVIERFLAMALPAVKTIEAALADLQTAFDADRLLHELRTDADGGH